MPAALPSDKTQALLWEPLELCRKLTLVGWVLLIGDEFEQARVLVALFLSIAFLTLHVSIKPFIRCHFARDPHPLPETCCGIRSKRPAGLLSGPRIARS